MKDFLNKNSEQLVKKLPNTVLQATLHLTVTYGIKKKV